MSADLDPVMFASADLETLSLIVEESDKRIVAQVQVMLASDARTTGLLAGSATLAAAAVAVASSEAGKSPTTALFIASAWFAVFAWASAALAGWALWPERMDVPGWSPRLFADDIREGRSRVQILADIAVLNQEKIDTNKACNARIAKRVMASVALLVVAPAAAVLAAFAVR